MHVMLPVQMGTHESRRGSRVMDRPLCKAVSTTAQTIVATTCGHRTRHTQRLGACYGSSGFVLTYGSSWLLYVVMNVQVIM